MVGCSVARVCIPHHGVRIGEKGPRREDAMRRDTVDCLGEKAGGVDSADGQDDAGNRRRPRPSHPLGSYPTVGALFIYTSTRFGFSEQKACCNTDCSWSGRSTLWASIPMPSAILQKSFRGWSK